MPCPGTVQSTHDDEGEVPIGNSKCVDEYLAYLGFSNADIKLNLNFLTALQRAHLTKVPFENIDIVAGTVPPISPTKSMRKIVHDKRGGWCFENNGAFYWLLTSLGFRVRRFVAAVLLHGPRTTLDHLCLEVMLDETPYLVEAGFGDSMIRPLPLNERGRQNDLAFTFEIVEKDGEFTLMKYDDDGVALPQYRFQRIDRKMGNFVENVKNLAVDPTAPFAKKMFATRLIDGGPDRVTLLQDRLKIRKDGVWSETPVADEEWDDTLEKWFGFKSRKF